jgi:diguanylate cyclase (GGDEF)-like protein
MTYAPAPRWRRSVGAPIVVREGGREVLMIDLIDLFRDIVLAAAGVLVLVVLNRANSLGARLPRRVWIALLIGFSLLFMGRVLEMLNAWGMVDSPFAKLLLQEILGFCVGFAVLAFGLIEWARRTAPPGKRRGRAPRPGARPVVVPAPSVVGEHTASEMLTSILKCSLSGVLVLKVIRDKRSAEIIDYKVEVMNEAAEQILGRSSTYLIGRALLKEFPCIRDEGLLGDTVSVIETGLPYKNERIFTQGREGRWYQFVAVKLGDGLAVTFGDVSDRKRAEEQLRHAAHHDTLTGLPNRALFTERLQQALTRAKRFPDYKFAVLFLDFDRFKVINDSLGHEAGDQLLIGISERLRRNLRGIDFPSRMSDEHMPARLGGDEFVILLDNISDVRDVVRVAERLQVELSAPHNIAGHDVVSTASIGVVTSDLGYNTCDDIIRDADTAMYRAKTSGKARHVVFDERMHQEVVRRLELEQQLREAVESCAFELEFEPIVTLESGRLTAVEAHVCWSHPTRGRLDAAEFVGLAEEMNLMVPIGEWGLRAACEQLRDWREEFPDHPGLAVHVNLSRPQLVHPEMVPHLEQVLSETGVPPTALRLELNETLIMSDPSSTGLVFKSMEELGVRLVMDDFGTGSSSLSCLHRFPIDMLKIDRDFINGVRKRRDYGAIVHAIVELAHNLGLEVVAAGVETDDQLALLQALDCDFAQGERFCKPVTAADLKAMITTNADFRSAA